jgi:DNA (cytosine-5)-methyltransferase 1
LKYFSMFSGIGGFELGIGLAALKAGIDATCVGYSEIDQAAIATYEEHFDHRNFGDITAIDADGLPDFDLLVGGFPCQSFSIAGKRGGFADTRGTLFFDVARILKSKRPRHFILENVRGLLSHDSGRTLQTILGVLTDLGYSTEWQVLNSKNFGVPQSRERIYLVGHYGGLTAQSVFPFTGGSGLHLKEVTQGVSDAQRIYRPTVARTLKALGGGQGGQTGLYVDEKYFVDSDVAAGIDTAKVRDHLLATGDVAVGITREGRGSDGDRLELREVAGTLNTTCGKGLDKRSQRTGIAYHPEHIPVVRNKRSGVVVYSERDGANCIDASYGKGLDYHGQRTGIATVEETQLKVRRLTPLETERLQGFPDGWTIGSDTQRYRQCGNAVTVNVVEAVMGRLIEGRFS